MMKILSIAAMAGLLALTACGSSPDTASVQNNADMIAAELEQKADNMEAMADSATNASVAAMLEGAADNLEENADNVRDNAGSDADKF
jgi:hypothetical protein